MVATFCVGLRDDSRIKLKMSGMKVPLHVILSAIAVDQLKLLVWSKTKDAEKGMNRPKPISLMFMDKTEDDNLSFSSSEEFEKAKSEILKGG